MDAMDAMGDGVPKSDVATGAGLGATATGEGVPNSDVGTEADCAGTKGEGVPKSEVGTDTLEGSTGAAGGAGARFWVIAKAAAAGMAPVLSAEVSAEEESSIAETPPSIVAMGRDTRGGGTIG